jgi:hypothetical protein
MWQCMKSRTGGLTPRRSRSEPTIGTPVGFIVATSDTLLEFDAIFACLSRAFPGTDVVDGDYCATVISRLADIARTRSEPDNRLTHARETARKLGLTRQVRVPLDGGVQLLGTISNAKLLLSTTQPISIEALDPVRAALAEFPVLRINIGGLPPDPTRLGEGLRLRRREFSLIRYPWWRYYAMVDSVSPNGLYRCTVDGDNRTVWMYLLDLQSGNVIADSPIGSLVEPMTLAEFKKSYQRGATPPLVKEYSTDRAIGANLADLVLKWADDGNAVVALLEGDPVTMVVAGEGRGYSKAVSKEGPWGRPWDEKAYTDRFDE